MNVAKETVLLAHPFKIAGRVFDRAEVVVVTLRDGDLTGRGEASGVFFLGDDVAHMCAELERVRTSIEASPTRDELRTLLPPGGARNAVDCALWELEAARSGQPVWQLAGVGTPKPLLTTFTLGADDPERMAQGARSYTQASSIKVKLTGDPELDAARVTAIREARPDAWLGVDGNQGFSIEQLKALIPVLEAQRVSLIEQPLARDRDEDLEGLNSPIRIAGDESILSSQDIAAAVGRFDVINIKLDKCGGLTEGLLMVREARRHGLGVMVGTMVSTSLATAPAFVLGQLCDLVDLDSPTFLASDRLEAVEYRNGTVWSGPSVWGTPATAAD
jgi:L-alanine-DL-glutamate epimerase-like enolase superfamily enzyme